METRLLFRLQRCRLVFDQPNRPEGQLPPSQRWSTMDGEEWRMSRFLLLFIYPSSQGLFSSCFPQPVLWQADRWAVFTSVPFAGRIAMLCRRSSDIPPQCNHNAPHINFNAAEEPSMHHFCSVLSHYGYTWTHIHYLSQSAARRGWEVSEMAKWVPTRTHQRPSVASGLFPFVKVLWTDRDHLQEGESTAGVLVKADRSLLHVVHGSPSGVATTNHLASVQTLCILFSHTI